MSEYKVLHVDSNGDFKELGPITDFSISSTDFGRRVTISACDDPCLSGIASSIYSKKYMDSKVENMFDKIKDYKVYGKTTVVYFTDGTKETVVCSDEDNFDLEHGIIMCVIKRMLGDKYKKSVKSIIKAKTLNEKNLQELEAANKENQLREARKEKRNRENKLRMKARYEAKLAVAIEEEKKKLKNR